MFTNNPALRIAVVLIAAAALTTPALAQPAPPDFSLDWYSIDGGGQMFSVSRSFELGGTIGQHDAVQLATGGGFELMGGFWAVALVSNAPPCPGDLNGDGSVDITDLAMLLSNFGMAGGAMPEDGDSDGDGDVDITDLASFLSNFGTSCP